MAWWWWLELARAAVCADDPVADLEATMTGVIDANAQVDELAYDRSAKLMDASLTCIDAPLPPSTLARLHYTMALRSFIAGQSRAARRSLAALRLVDPRFEMVFPEGHPFRSLWEQATDPGPVQPIGRIAPRAWIVDGVERNEVPTERAFLLQVREADGDVPLTRYLFDVGDVPELGQNDKVDLSATPATLSVRATLFGRVLGQAQTGSPGGELVEQRASGASGGGALLARYTPSALLGGELSVGMGVGDDMIAGGATGLDGRAVGLFGSGVAAVGRSALYVAGRAGVVTDSFRAWPRVTAGVAPEAWRLWGPSLGAEAGIRGRRGEIDLALDGALAGFSSPWRLDGRLGATRMVDDGLGLRGQVDLRTQSQPLLTDNEVAARALERELRLGVGLDWVF